IYSLYFCTMLSTGICFYIVSLHDALPIFISHCHLDHVAGLHTLTKFRFRHPLQICGQPGTEALLRSIVREPFMVPFEDLPFPVRSEEHTSELQSRENLVCRLLLEKKN